MKIKNTSAILCAFSALSAFILAGCGNPPPENALAVVEGHPITFSDVEAFAARGGHNIYDGKGHEAALRDAVNFEILAAEAEDAGYFDDPEIQRYVKNMAVDRLVRDKVDAELEQEKTEITEGELRKYYDEHEADFKQPALAKAQVLFIMKRLEGGKGEVVPHTEKLAAAMKALDEEMAFGEVVKLYSDRASDKMNGGITNWIIEGKENKLYPAELIKALFEQERTEGTEAGLLGPFETPQGVYLAKLVEKRDARATSFSQAGENLKRQVFRQKRVAAYDDYVEQVRRGADVQEFPEKLEAQLEAAKTRSGPPMGPVQIARDEKK